MFAQISLESSKISPPANFRWHSRTLVHYIGRQVIAVNTRYTNPHLHTHAPTQTAHARISIGSQQDESGRSFQSSTIPSPKRTPFLQRTPALQRKPSLEVPRRQQERQHHRNGGTYCTDIRAGLPALAGVIDRWASLSGPLDPELFHELYSRTCKKNKCTEGAPRSNSVRQNNRGEIGVLGGTRRDG